MSASAKQPSQESVRLQVLLARSGLGSRRACEEYIRKGRVSVDGVAVTEAGVRVNPSQSVAFDTEPIRPKRSVCYILNKPKGYLCTNSDPSGRPRVIDLFPADAGRVFPIGRLDENSVGLLLVTNDGELSHQLAHPKFQVPKVYQVQVAGIPNAETLKKAREGVYFSDGLYRVGRVKKLKSKGQSTVLEVMLSEGRNREIRRLFARLGHKVMRLERVSFGPLELRNVALGRYRALTKKEMTLLTDYIKHGAQRRREDSTKRPQRKSAQSDRRRTLDPPQSVEVTPFENLGGLDITGRRRNQTDSEQEPERPEVTPKQHPALVKPAVGKPAKVQPASDRPGFGKQASRGKPASGKPASGKPASGKPASGKPVSGKPVSGKPVSGKPASGKPASGKPASSKPASGKPASGKPASGKPASGKAASGKAATGKPVSGKATSHKIASSKRATGKPASGKPAFGKRAAGKPTTSKKRRR